MNEITVADALRMVDGEFDAANVAHECPPHLFMAAWATPANDPTGDTVSCIFCQHCGEIRALRIPA